MMGTIFQTPKQATAMAGMILLPLMMFGGLYSNMNSYPNYIGWLQYISPFKYGFQAVISNQLKGVVWLAKHG
jgi:ATP-binding cassette subfamily G (WHITE) protein 1